MVYRCFALALLASCVALLRAEESIEARVAFKCGKPAMHSTTNGQSWVKDDSTGCLTEPVDILNYCRKVYPSLDVRNIVESTESVKIQNWCASGVSVCNTEYTVTPYRCIVGAFQSDALLVPEHCVFDHIHDSSLCTTFDEWNKNSVQACKERQMIQQSFAMLQPCGIDRFSGVEFVCCPTKQDVSERRIVVTSGSSQSQPQQKRNKKEESEVDESTDFGRYIQRQGDRGKNWNEHDAFVKARDDVQKHHHDKIAKMMKDWAAARQRVQALRSTDPKQSEALNKDITSRFQKMYEAEEVESSMERKQLKQLHEQRVQAEILEKKEQAFDEYANAVGDQNADAADILRTLKRYVKRLHKDRMHTINHYEHIEETDPEEADNIHADTAEHLRRVDQQLTDALSMLNRVPKIKTKILQQLKVFLDAYHSMDKDAALILLTAPAHNQPTTTGKPDSSEESQDSEDDDDESYDDDDDDFDDETMEDERVIDASDADKYQIVEETTRRPSTTVHSPDDSQSKEGEEEVHHLPGFSNDRHDDAANIDVDLFAVNPAYISRAGDIADRGMSGGTVALIICCALGLVAMVTGALVMVMRQRRHRYSRPLRLNLDPAIDYGATPEEKHVATMQMNGYENPTYKFFEQQNPGSDNTANA